MVPNISSEIVSQLKSLKPGNCIAFGNAFKVPMSMYVQLPNPRPLSNNVDLDVVWYKKENNTSIINNDSININFNNTGFNTDNNLNNNKFFNT